MFGLLNIKSWLVILCVLFPISLLAEEQCSCDISVVRSQDVANMLNRVDIQAARIRLLGLNCKVDKSAYCEECCQRLNISNKTNGLNLCLSPVPIVSFSVNGRTTRAVLKTKPEATLKTLADLIVFLRESQVKNHKIPLGVQLMRFSKMNKQANNGYNAIPLIARFLNVHFKGSGICASDLCPDLVKGLLSKLDPYIRVKSFY